MAPQPPRCMLKATSQSGSPTQARSQSMIPPIVPGAVHNTLAGLKSPWQSAGGSPLDGR